MLTDARIEEEKKKFGMPQNTQSSSDCVRIAYAWFDAQVKTGRIARASIEIKNVINAWGARYVSIDDVEIAACLHPEIRGSYPSYNIHEHFTRPNKRRLACIPEVGKRPYIGSNSRFD